MSYISRLSILKRIMLLCIFPLLALIALSGNKLYDSWNEYTKTVSLLHIIKITPDISNLVHELQKERGRSAGFLSSKGAKFSNKIIDARKSTDAALAAYQKIKFEELGMTKYEHFSKPYNLAIQELNELKDYRAKVSRQELSVKQMAGFYTKLITHLLEMVESVEDASENGELVRLMIAYNAILHGKEYAGLERAMGAAGFGAGQFKKNIYANLIQFIGNQKAKFSDFKHHATKAELKYFKEIQNQPSFKELERLRQIALDNPFGGETQGVTAGYWFATTTNRINAIKTLEDKVAKDIFALANNIKETNRNNMLVFLTAIIILFVVTALLSFWVSSSIIGQIKKLTSIMQRLSREDTSAELLYLDRKDELGAMAQTIDIFRENSIERHKLRMEAVAEREKEAQKQSYITNVINDFKELDEEIRRSLEEQTSSMEASANSLNDSAKNVSDRAGQMKNSSVQASGNVEDVAASTKELSESMQEIASQIHKAEKIVREASETTEKTDAEISSLGDSADKIGDVIQLVRDIAEQTNLLALNATIEAARAGQAGKGFAVVAQEVKQLSEQTAKAIDEIVTQISAVQNSSHGAIQAIRNIHSKVKDISTVTVSITAAIEEQQTATHRIAESIDAVSKETNNVATDVEDVNVSIDHTFEEADNVKKASSSLATVSNRLAKSVSTFLHEVGEDVKNRRAHLRKQVNKVGVINHDGHKTDFMIKNASADGMYISGEANLAIGSKIELELSDGKLVEAEIVRVEDGGFGVKFDEPIPGIKWLKEGLDGDELQEAS